MNDNNPSPLVPQGSLLEQKAKSKASLPVAFFIFLALHAVVLGGFLMVGCRPDDAAKNGTASSTTKTNEAAATDLGPLNTNLGGATAGLYAPPSNPASPATLTATNPPAFSNSTVAAIPAAPFGGLGTTASPVDNTMAPVTTAAPGSTSEYKIAKGDTLALIAKKQGVTLSALQKANPGVNSSKLKVGQKIQIPAPSEKTATASTKTTPDAPAAATGASGDATTYVVKPGDTLTKVAKSHGTTVKAVRAANNLKTDRVNVGQKLKLPAAKTAAATDTGTNPATGTAHQ